MPKIIPLSKSLSLFCLLLLLSLPVVAEQIEDENASLNDESQTAESSGVDTPQSTNLAAFLEQSDDINVQGISISQSGVAAETRIEGGVSFSHIEFKQPPSTFKRENYYPVYAFINVQMNAKYTPYLEVGFDLGDAILGEIFDSEDGEGICCDAYLSLGGKVRLHEKVTVSAYWKIYEHVYDSLPVNKSNRKTFTTNSLGLQASYHF